MSILKNITTSEMPNADMFKFVVDAGANIIISTPPGLGTVTSSIEALKTISDTFSVVDTLALHDDCLNTELLDLGTDILVLDEAHLATPGVQELIHEVMTERTFNSQPMPNLKSVVMLFTHRNADTDKYAAKLAKLAPALCVTLS